MATGSPLALRRDSIVDANLPLGDLGLELNFDVRLRGCASLEGGQYCTQRLALPE